MFNKILAMIMNFDSSSQTSTYCLRLSPFKVYLLFILHFILLNKLCI